MASVSSGLRARQSCTRVAWCPPRERAWPGRECGGWRAAGSLDTRGRAPRLRCWVQVGLCPAGREFSLAWMWGSSRRFLRLLEWDAFLH